MYRHSRRTGFLDDLRDLHRIYVVVVKAFSDLHRHRLSIAFTRGADKLIDQLRVLHQRGALAVFDNLRHGPAHVDVKNGKGSLFNPFRHLAHNLRVGAKQLQDTGRSSGWISSRLSVFLLL